MMKPLFISLTALLLMAASAPAQIKVLTYNIHHGKGLDGKLDLERIARVIAAENPDLVALQEVDKNTSRTGKVDQTAVLAKKLGYHHAFGKAINVGGGEYGNAVLSRFPILSTKVHSLPGGPEARVALEVTVDAPIPGHPNATVPALFLSVHLDHTGQSTERQAEALSAALAATKTPVIIAGDFNSTRDSGTFATFTKHFTASPAAGATCPADTPQTEIDYVIYRGFPAPATAKVIDEAVASDHRPLFVTIPTTPK